MADMMTFPDTWEEFEQFYGITDTEQVYTNGARLIPSFRVRQWFEHKETAIDESNFSQKQYLADLQSAYDCGYEKGKSEQRWIPVSERLPEEGRECWITAKTTEEVYRGIFTEFYGIRHDVGFICDDGFMWWNTAKAWMYCEKPEPYKESEE